MRIIIAIALAATLIPAGTGAHAQVEAPKAPLELYKMCMNDAIAKDMVRKESVGIEFTCRGYSAEQFYLALGVYGLATSESGDAGGRLFTRYTDDATRGPHQDVCMHRMAPADPNGADSYVCKFYFGAGPFINR